MAGLSELPPQVYTQEDIKDPTLKGVSAYLIYFLIALAAGVAFATQYFAFSLDFSSSLVTSAYQVGEMSPRRAKAFRILAYACAAVGLMGLPLGYWYSKQPQTIRFRGVAALCLLLLSAAPLFYVYSFPYSYSPWLYLKWAFVYRGTEPLHPALLRSGGYGLGVVFLSYLGIYLSLTGQVFEISGAYGSAHWGDGEWFAEGKPQTTIGKSLSQAEDAGVPIGWRGDRMLFDREGLHAYVQAPTGSGKTTGFVVPTLLLHQGSVLTIDIKRELYFVAARRRSEVNEDVYRLDPFATDIDPARYNPLDLIDTTPQVRTSRAVDDARRLAHSLVIKEKNTSQNPFFPDSARALVFGLILFVCATCKKGSGRRNLGTVRDLLMQPIGRIEDTSEETPVKENTIRATLHEMADFDPQTGSYPACSTDVAKSIQDMGNRFKVSAKEEFNSILSTAQTNTRFLGSEVIRDSLSETSFKFEEMQTRSDGISVFLALPAERLSEYFRWLRLIIVSARTELLRLSEEDRKNLHPTLFMIEEAPRLGGLEAIDEGVSMDRNAAHIQYMIVTQSFEQLKDAYGPEIANNIFGNCRLRMMFGAATPDDAELISNICGEQTVAFETSNTSRTTGGGGKQKSVTDSIQEGSRSLVTPDEVRRIATDWTFVFTQGHAPPPCKAPCLL
jgi:Type IV secretory pathway, VirD4 components